MTSSRISAMHYTGTFPLNFLRDDEEVWVTDPVRSAIEIRGPQSSVRVKLGEWIEREASGALRVADRPASPVCVRCGKPVIRNVDSYHTFEQMHWLCFHLEFEHGDEPDGPCGDPDCPMARRLSSSDADKLATYLRASTMDLPEEVRDAWWNTPVGQIAKRLEAMAYL